MISRNRNKWSWALRIVAAGIMLQTLYFKFTASPESVYIFSKVGMEPWGRILIGIFELIASVLILIPRTTAYGALIGIGVMTGALFMHFIRLGIEVQGDSGQLFIYALLVMCHMALMKIGVQTVTDITLPTHFGVAASTIEFRQARCAQ